MHVRVRGWIEGRSIDASDLSLPAPRPAQPNRSTRVVHMALELTEAVVKNGNESVHREVATPKYVG